MHRLLLILGLLTLGKGDFLIPVSAQPTGAYDSMRIGEPQTWLLTNTFEF